MSEVQRLWTLVVEGNAPESAAGRHDARDWQERSEHQNSNELAAQAIARLVLGRRLTQEELRLAAPLVHYLFGATAGAIYGAYAERRQADASGAGFGTTVWLAADELAMPLLGLSHSAARRPLEMHLQSLFAHLVYGTATEMTRRLVQARYDRARHLFFFAARRLLGAFAFREPLDFDPTRSGNFFLPVSRFHSSKV